MPRIAVVFVSYLKVPESRLMEHFKWNGAIYDQYGEHLRAYVVSDVERSLPDYAETVIFPVERLPVVKGKPRFSLTMTKNAGISKAIEDGARVIVSTDVDIAFGLVSFSLISTIDSVPDSAASIPIYRMAPCYAERDIGRLDHGCTGTVSMTAYNWRTIKYDERCVGYGADDGILVRDIRSAGLRVIRDCEVAHIAHVEGDGDRTPGSGSETCWGREDGFNFDNFRKNRRLLVRRGRRVRRRR